MMTLLYSRALRAGLTRRHLLCGSVAMLLLLLVSGAKAQNSIGVEVPVQQPSPSLNVRLAYKKVTTMNGQEFTCIVRNLTKQPQYVAFDMTAQTICGTEVVKHIEMDLGPDEKDGNGNAFNPEYLGYVKKADCEGVKFKYYSESAHMEMEGTNRIRSLGYRNFSVKSPASASGGQHGQPAGSQKPNSPKQGGTPIAGEPGANSDIPKGQPGSKASSRAPTDNDQPVGSYQPPADPLAQANAAIAQGEMNKALFNSRVAALSDALKDAYKAQSDKALASALQKSDRFYSISKQVGGAKSAATMKLIYATDPDTISELALQALSYNATENYNRISIQEYTYATKNSKNSVPGNDNYDALPNYFPNESEDIKDYSFINLFTNLPDLFLLPTCHCFSEKRYNRPVDSAFAYLRDIRKCKAITYGGNQYAIKTNKALVDKIDEATALSLLKVQIAHPRISDAFDLIDYFNAAAWVGYLGNKSSKNKGDLLEGLRSLEPFDINKESFIEVHRTLPTSEKEHFIAALTVVRFYEGLFYYRLMQITSDKKEKQKIAKVMRALVDAPDPILLFYNSTGTQQGVRTVQRAR